jgi:hypothetical protein
VSRPTRIARLLGIAGRREEAAERELLARQRAAADAEDAVDLARRHAAGPDGTEQPANVEDFLLRRRMAELRVQSVRDREAERALAEEEVLRARQEWLAAARHKRTVDRLDERDRAARAVVAARASQRTLDEVALRRLRDRT